MGVTSLAGLLLHARSGRVHWQTGLLFGAAGMAGGRVADYLPGVLLLAAFSRYIGGAGGEVWGWSRASFSAVSA